VTDFKALLDILTGAGVEFILVGGLAGIAHGSARLTQDIDVVYARSDENMEKLARALAQHQPYLRGAPPGLPLFSPSTNLLKIEDLNNHNRYRVDTSTGVNLAKRWLSRHRSSEPVRHIRPKNSSLSD
jgi:hypothetical protein